MQEGLGMTNCSQGHHRRPPTTLVAIIFTLRHGKGTVAECARQVARQAKFIKEGRKHCGERNRRVTCMGDNSGNFLWTYTGLSGDVLVPQPQSQSLPLSSSVAPGEEQCWPTPPACCHEDMYTASARLPIEPKDDLGKSPLYGLCCLLQSTNTLRPGGGRRGGPPQTVIIISCKYVLTRNKIQNSKMVKLKKASEEIFRISYLVDTG